MKTSIIAPIPRVSFSIFDDQTSFSTVDQNLMLNNKKSSKTLNFIAIKLMKKPLILIDGIAGLQYIQIHTNTKVD